MKIITETCSVCGKEFKVDVEEDCSPISEGTIEVDGPICFVCYEEEAYERMCIHEIMSEL